MDNNKEEHSDCMDGSMGDVLVFETDYRDAGYVYGMQIEANTIEQARQLAIQRGLGEHIHSAGATGTPRLKLPELINSGDYAKAIHEACLLGWVALESGASTPREILGDDGLIHQLAHLATNVFDETLEIEPEFVAATLADKMHAIERCKFLAKDLMWRVPGWPGRSYAYYTRKSKSKRRRNSKEKPDAAPPVP